MIIFPFSFIQKTEDLGPTSNGLILNLDASSYSGSGNWLDSSGNSNDATLINSPTYSPSFDGIFQFDDTSLEYATTPNLGDLPNWTVEVWFRLSSPLSGKITALVTNEFDLVNKLNFSIGTNRAPPSTNLSVGFFNGSWRTTTGFVPTTNIWYQVVGTYDGSVIRQYVNGTASGGTVNYGDTPLPSSGGGVRLMRRWDQSLITSNMVNGDLGIVRIYNRAISSVEVSTNFSAVRARYDL